MLGDRPMIQWVYEGASSLFEHLLVATDDQRISKAVLAFGGKVVMTSHLHNSGTERCAEALTLHRAATGIPFTHVVNIQGDEPLIQKEQLSLLIQCMQESDAGIATLIRPLEADTELKNPNVVKVVVDLAFRALYFSRSPIPYIREPQREGSQESSHFAHLGLYAFRTEILEKLVQLPFGRLEKAESLEQLRWLEHGYAIQTRITRLPSVGVDTPEDLEAIRSRL
jgi:3-deoxy-manno-octulosonate cytidylyltransferase (CMP-KDO synthetase)